MAYQTTLVDEVRYADPDDVAYYFRGKEFTASSDPTTSQVEEKLLKVSDRIDQTTGRAWRTRRAEDLERGVEFSREQRGLAYRKRNRRFQQRTTGVFMNNRRRRAVVFLPHIELQSWDPNEGDSLVILNRDGEEDISANEGRDDDSDFVVDEKAGLIRIDLKHFRTGPLRGGEIQEPALVRLSYRYGSDEQGNTVSQSAPGDISEACAKLVAADLVRSDSYSDMVPGGDDGIDMENSAGRWEEQAEEFLRRWSRNQLV